VTSGRCNQVPIDASPVKSRSVGSVRWHRGGKHGAPEHGRPLPETGPTAEPRVGNRPARGTAIGVVLALVVPAVTPFGLIGGNVVFESVPTALWTWVWNLVHKPLRASYVLAPPELRIEGTRITTGRTHESCSLDRASNAFRP
jgi:hypothetical protein